MVGVGIHTGRTIRLKLLPAPESTGVVFRRVDSRGIEIPALGTSVTDVTFATTLGRDDVIVSTVEHLLAAVRMMDVDNLVIELDGPEIPILDGSALPFLRLLQAAGIQRQEAERAVLAVTRPLELEMGGKRIRLSPHPGLQVTYKVDFAHPAIGHQELRLEVDRASFERELAPARTFALWRDVEHMRQRGLALGGALDNCVLFGDDGPTNTTLRFPDEPVRHKAMDAVGDLALIGAPLWAHVEVERGGHQIHFSMVELLRQRPESWTWISSHERAERAAAAPRTAPGTSATV